MYPLRPRDNREGSQVRLTLSYFYQGTREQTEVITLPLDRETGTSPRLELQILLPRRGTGDQGLVSFTLANRGGQEAQNS